MAIKPQFARAREFFEDRACIAQGLDIGFIKPDGTLAFVFPRTIKHCATRFSNQRAYFEEGGRFGYVDVDGTVVVPPKYSSADDFSDGLACVELPLDGGEQGRYGMIDIAGAVVVPFEYDSLGMANEGLIPASRPGANTRSFVDYGGKVVLTLEGIADTGNWVRVHYPFSEGLAPVYIDGMGLNVPRACFIDRTGAIQGTSYDTVHPFSNGMAAVLQAGKYGFVNSAVELAIQPSFDDAGEFHDGRCRVRMGSEWHYIDQSGAVVAKAGPNDPPWNDAEDFYAGLARVHMGGTFDETDDGPQVWQGGEWDYIDLNGKVVAQCKFDGGGAVYYGKEVPPPN